MIQDHIPPAPDEKAPADRPARPSVPITLLWMGHGSLRLFAFYHLMIYGWMKLILAQMGMPDYASALVTLGEKSPMGLLWTFMGFSPGFQFLCGLAEVVAGVLLIWRRTTWLGGLLGTGAMGFVLLLNVLYDVGAKPLALIILVVCVLVLLPDLPRLLRFVRGLPVGAPFTPRPIPWPRVHAVTRWFFGTVGVLIVLAPLALVSQFLPRESDSELPGVYRVVEDTAAPVEQLAEDDRWQEVAFSQYHSMGNERLGFTLRHANGDLQEGRYEHTGEGEIEVELFEVMEGSRSLVRDPVESFTLLWSVESQGRVHLQGGDQDLIVEFDPELSYFFDHEPSWIGHPVNR